MQYTKATVNTKPPYTVTGIIIHKLAASVFKPRGSKRGKKVAAYRSENAVVGLAMSLTNTQSPLQHCLKHGCCIFVESLDIACTQHLSPRAHSSWSRAL